jgi:hypothetical protein
MQNLFLILSFFLLECESAAQCPPGGNCVNSKCGKFSFVLTRDGIHESTISLRFLGIILRFLRLEVCTFVYASQNMIFMNKLD